MIDFSAYASESIVVWCTSAEEVEEVCEFVRYNGRPVSYDSVKMFINEVNRSSDGIGIRICIPVPEASGKYPDFQSWDRIGFYVAVQKWPIIDFSDLKIQSYDFQPPEISF